MGSLSMREIRGGRSMMLRWNEGRRGSITIELHTRGLEILV